MNQLLRVHCSLTAQAQAPAPSGHWAGRMARLPDASFVWRAVSARCLWPVPSGWVAALPRFVARSGMVSVSHRRNCDDCNGRAYLVITSTAISMCRRSAKHMLCMEVYRSAYYQPRSRRPPLVKNCGEFARQLASAGVHMRGIARSATQPQRAATQDSSAPFNTGPKSNQ